MEETGQLGQVTINRDAVTREIRKWQYRKDAADRPAYVSRTAKRLPSIAEMRRARFTESKVRESIDVKVKVTIFVLQ